MLTPYRLILLAALVASPSMAVQLSNDDCSGAQPVWGGVFEFTNVSSTESLPQWPSCDCSHGSVAGGDVWFRYVATEAGVVRFTSCGFDTMMELFDGECGSLFSRGCSDDCGGCGLGSTKATSVLAGDVVHVRLTGFAGQQGVGTLTVEDTGRGPLGGPVCGSTANSTGVQGVMRVFGQEHAVDNDVELIATNLPSNALSMMLASQTQTQTMFAGGSSGHLCLGGDIARFAAQVGVSQSGVFRHAIDLTSIPEPPTFATSVMAGETWSFQCWHRDAGSTGPTSNFTGAASVQFL